MNGDVDFYSGIIKNWMDRTFDFRYKYLQAQREVDSLKVEVQLFRDQLAEEKDRLETFKEAGELCDRQIGLSHKTIEIQRGDLLSLCQRIVQWDDDLDGTSETLDRIFEDTRKKIEEINRQDEPWEC